MDKRSLARERIDILFDEAAAAMPDHPDRASRYVDIAKRLAMRVNMPLPRAYRKKICDGCGAFLVPGTSARVRLDSDHQVKVIACMDCGERMRFPYG